MIDGTPLIPMGLTGVVSFFVLNTVVVTAFVFGFEFGTHYGEKKVIKWLNKSRRTPRN